MFPFESAATDAGKPGPGAGRVPKRESPVPAALTGPLNVATTTSKKAPNVRTSPLPAVDGTTMVRSRWSRYWGSQHYRPTDGARTASNIMWRYISTFEGDPQYRRFWGARAFWQIWKRASISARRFRQYQ